MDPERGSTPRELHIKRTLQTRYEKVMLELLRTAVVAKRPATRVVEGKGLSLAQYNVLRILRGAEADGLPTLSIRERMVEDAAGITRLIDKLEAAGFVRRDRSSEDRRQVVCRITSSGATLLDSLDGSIQQANYSAFADLQESDLDELSRILDIVRSKQHPGLLDEGGRRDPDHLLRDVG